MKKKNPLIGLFFGLIIISIPIFNQLHYSLIDHYNTIDKNNKEVIHHQCHHFTFYNLFLDTHDEFKLNTEKEFTFNLKIIVNKIDDVISSIYDLQLNRGPPFF